MRKTGERKSLKLACQAVVVAFTLVGCASSPPIPPSEEIGRRSSADTGFGEEIATIEENFALAESTDVGLLSSLHERREAFSTIHAGVEMRWTSPEWEGPVSCRGTVVFQAPGLLQIRGTTNAFFTIFHFKAGPEEVSVDVPHERVLVRGRRDDPEWGRLGLNPGRLITALLAAPADSSMERGLWVEDQVSGLPQRYHALAPESWQVTWENWSERAGQMWPDVTRMQNLATGEALELEWGRVEFGRVARPKSFEEVPDEPRKQLSASDAQRTWNQWLQESRGEVTESR